MEHEFLSKNASETMHSSNKMVYVESIRIC